MELSGDTRISGSPTVYTVAQKYGMSVEIRSEVWTSQECPNCGSTEETTRHRDTLTCPCGFEGHADLVGVRDVPSAADNGTTVDGTACMPRVGRS